MFDLSALVLCSVASFVAGGLTLFLLLVVIGGRERARPAPHPTPLRPHTVQILVHHRHDVHHTGLPREDTSGDEWKNT